MWIDTHCHLDAAEFGAESGAIAARALDAQVSWIVIPAVDVQNFDTVRALANGQPNCAYALGIHPMCVPNASVARGQPEGRGRRVEQRHPGLRHAR